jgi:hypothetical protein
LGPPKAVAFTPFGASGSKAADADSKPVTDRPSNPLGAVFVLEYHHLGTSRNSMFRTPDLFRGDLERLDKMGFRPETVTDYLNGSKELAKGASPAVFTFDDSNADQVKLNPDGSLAPDCFLGIWQEFAKTHPEFPIRATFFVLPDTMWGQPKMLPAKLQLLAKLGCELGNHTMTHPILRKLTDEKAEWEIGAAEERLEKLGVPMPASLALPFGVSPRNKSILAGFDYDGKHVAPKAVFLVGANPAPPIGSPKFNRLRIPRIQAYEGPFGIKYWLEKVQGGDVKLYVK